MEKRLIKIGEAAALLGIAVSTLRKWEKTGELSPARKTNGGTRYYDASVLLGLGDADAPTVCYVRLYGSRSKKNKQLMDALGSAVKQ